MKMYYFLLLALLPAALVAAPDNKVHIQEPTPLAVNELSMLDQMIEVTKQNLDEQKSLRGQIVDYQKLQSQYVKTPEDKELLYRTVKVAHQILDNIKSMHLVHTFSPEFISELTLFAQIAQKRGIPKP